MKTHTVYIVVESNGLAADKVANFLDNGYTLIISWATDNTVHHILTKEGV